MSSHFAWPRMCWDSLALLAARGNGVLGERGAGAAEGREAAPAELVLPASSSLSPSVQLRVWGIVF